MSFNTANPGQTMTVNFTLANGGGRVGEQDILLTLENGTKTTVDQLNNVSLQGGNSGQYSLVWDIPLSQELQPYNICIETDQDYDCFFDPLGVYDTNSINGFESDWNFSSGNGVEITRTGVYTGGGGTFYRLSRRDGSIIWSSNQFQYGAEPRGIGVGEDKVAVCDTGNQLRLFDIETGTQEWSASVSNNVFGSTSISENEVFVGYRDGNNDGRARGYSIEDGTLLWQNGYSSTTNVEYLPDADILTAHGGYQSSIVGLNPSDGSQLWSSAVPSRPFDLASSGSVVYYNEYDRVSAWDSNGNNLWNNGSYSKGSIGYGAGAVYTEEAVLDPSDGSFITNGIGQSGNGSGYLDKWVTSPDDTGTIRAYTTTQ